MTTFGVPQSPVGLFYITKAEPKERLEEELEMHGSFVRQMIAPQRPEQPAKSNQEIHDILASSANASNENHEKVCLGLLYIILTSSETAPRSFQDLTLITRDHFGLILTKLNIIIMEKYFRLLDTARQQLVWIVQQLVSSRCVGANQCCICLMKNIIGGDVSSKNIWLAERLLEICQENEIAIFENDNLLLGHFIFTYLRLICDHRGTKYENLRKNEIKFCVSLLRSRFMDCCVIGRDLVRLLMNVARIPEFQQLWKDILYQPQTLSPKFNGILSLLHIRSQRKFIASRLTIEMENKLNFLMSKVKFGNHKRYQEWFHKSYLSTAESQNLCPDLIRYICCVIHPTNEILCSDIIPRWAVIGWLLLQCKSNSIAAECKLALFFDWLTFQLDKDNIMNIEPAVLVMYHNLKHHTATSITLLDFLIRIQADFYPPLQQALKQGVHNSFKLLLEKRVLPSLAPIFESNKLDPELKAQVKANFGDFMEAVPVPLPGPGVVNLPPPPPTTDHQKVTQALMEDISPLAEQSSSSETPTSGLVVPPTTPSAYDSGLDSGGEGGVGGGKNEFSSDEEEVDELRPPPVILDEEDCTFGIATSSTTEEQQTVNVNSTAAISASLKHTKPPASKDSKIVNSGSFVEYSYSVQAVKELIVYPIVDKLEQEDISKYFSQIDVDMLDYLKQLHKEDLVTTNASLASELIKKICEIQATYQDATRESCVPLAACLCSLLVPNFQVPVLKKGDDGSNQVDLMPALGLSLNDVTAPNNGSIAGQNGWDKYALQVLKKPLYAVFQVLCQPECDSLSLSHMVAQMYELNSRVGYHLLFYLAATANQSDSDRLSQASSTQTATSTDPKDVYVDVMLNSLDEEISTALVKDMHMAAKHDMNLFMKLLPYIFTNFSQEVRGSVPMARLVVSSIDPKQLNNIISLIMLDELEVVEEESVYDILVDSLQWESFEQLFLWQLIGAHELSSESIVPIIHKINWNKDSEAASAIVLRLKREKPNFDVLKHIYSRHTTQSNENEQDDDQMSTSLLYYWSVTCASQLADLTKRLINGTSSSGKSSQAKIANAIHQHRNPTLTEILRHLDKLRLNVDYKNDDFFSQDAINDALKFAHSHIYKSQREEFQDLFGLINLTSPPSTSKRSASRTATISSAVSTAVSSASSGRNAKRSKRESSIEISTDSDSSNDTPTKGSSVSSSSKSAPKKKARRSTSRTASSKSGARRNSNEKSTHSSSSNESDSSG